MKENNTFKKFVDNCYSKDDYLKVVEQFENDESFDATSEEMKQLWDEFKTENISEQQRLRIRKEIEANLKFKGQKGIKPYVHRIYHAANKIAAILIIPFIIASVFLFYQLNKSQKSEDSFAEVYCPLGTRTQLNLPDGTSVWLNSGSTLKYPIQFANNRNVELNGEAYFDVVENERSPFEVNTKHFEVIVLGTEFNVLSYNEDETFAVTLESGKVEISEKKSTHKLTLKPSYQFAFDKEKHDGSLLKVQTEYYTSWKEGKLMFRNTPLSEVFSRLGRWYNVDVVCEDAWLFEQPYRATFQEETLDHVLKLLSITAPIKYEIVEPKTLKNGTYEKQKIIITRK